MADVPHPLTSQDFVRINLDEGYDIGYWTHEFGVTEARLRSAVALAGTFAQDVRDYLGVGIRRPALTRRGTTYSGETLGRQPR